MARGISSETIGPYRILGTLGAGGMGVVYRAARLETGELAAVKTVLPRSEAVLQSLRREIHALARLEHPGIVRVLDEGVDGERPWYAMELLRGTSLRLHTRRLAAAEATPAVTASVLESPPTSVEPSAHPTSLPPITPTVTTPERTEKLLTIFRRLCGPLAFLHGEGLVHRDLKPDNVVIRDDGTPVLIDFGLASQFEGKLSLGLQQSTPGTQGTYHYMAPEAIDGRVADARADLYALGCMLFEAFAGRVPFTGTVAEIAAGHRYERSPKLEDHAPGLPEGLYDLVDRLLEKDPRDRIGYADDVAERLTALGASGADRREAPPSRGYLYRAELAGREPVLSRLLRTVFEEQGSLVLLAGESGVGKTRLLLELIRRARSARADVLSGECTPDGRRPLDALRPMLHTIGDRCRASGPATTERILGPRGKLFSPIEPALGELRGTREHADPPPLVGEQAARRLLQALADTILTLADRSVVLVVLDDIQWADELTLRFLQLVANEQPFSSSSVCVVAAYRSEESRPEIDALTTSAAARAVPLGRLDPAAVTAIVGEMLAMTPPPPALSAHLSSSSEGNPFFVAEYLRIAVDSGLLSRADGTCWRLREGRSREADDAAYAALPLPKSLRALVEQRLRGLSDDALRVASVAAVLGRECESELLAPMLEMTDDRMFRGTSELLARHILEEPSPGLLRFAHDKLREVTEESIVGEERTALHRAAAAMYEDRLRRGPDAERRREQLSPALARHHALAGNLLEAAKHERIAGAMKLRASALVESIAHYRRAVDLADLVPESPEMLALRTELRLQLYVPRMQLHSAADENLVVLCEEAAALAGRLGDQALLARVLASLGGTYLTRGQYVRSHEHCLRSIRAAACTTSPRTAGAFAAMVACIGSIQRADLPWVLEEAPRWIEGLEQLGVTASTLSSPYPPYVSLCGGLAIANALMKRDQPRGELIAKAVAAGEASRDKYGLAYAHLTCAWAYGASGDAARTIAHGELAMRLADEAGLSGPKLLGSYCAGLGYALEGRASEAIDALERALELASKLGYAAFRTEAYCGLAIAHAKQREFERSKRACDAGLELAVAMGELKLESELHRLSGEALFGLDAKSHDGERHLRESLRLAESRELWVFAAAARDSLGRCVER